ncbi:GntR family transcriptional regulator [Polynucleobacter sp. 71A-WALBACH]|uniref:GntR family transcriptional regulator n=1 Tax=Polynucleobacter sp. 71A-WALBACH TaxID=2689097 RepID=UPI001C0BCDE5|nr:GntR family transcriptional regulator [Polynucleobacter sp. 71A-WALBACH]MBU3593426.1 GntR family transcriptional regulator [Polynucleobacter sp. 71A-WALBACH]
MMLAPPPKPQSLREYVESYLKQAIVGGKYKPGDRLIEREICELLGVSRPPVREALRQLEADKLITHELHRGPVVASVSCEEASELYAFRALLESFAVAEFSRLASDAQIKELGNAIKKLNEAATIGERQPLVDAKSHVYNIILDGCGNKLVSESLNKLLDRVNILRGTSLLQPDRLGQSLKEIDQMFKAIKNRDYEQSKALAYDHIQKACKIALRVLSEPPV